MLPGMELMGCNGLSVPGEVMHHVVKVESSYNRFAIGVVGGRLVRQPKTLPEALATVRMLESKGYNFSLGLAQVNRYNLSKYGLDSYEKAFDVCPNLQAGSRILAECYGRSGGDWGKSFSCYYSGNFVTGYRHGYVQKVYASINGNQDTREGTGVGAIAVVGKPSRRQMEITRYPSRSSLPPVEQRIADTAAVPAPPERLPPMAQTARPSTSLATSAIGGGHVPAASVGAFAATSAPGQPTTESDGSMARQTEHPRRAIDEAFVF
ncbi:type IV secretion system protein VirB1 [Pseudoxanthomonas wuyuanensis]|uniref:Type IV secretion system protein VirB1 n=2 Tax=Pseudoxanthomonas wuyuanensis TaxID=1073196 RepID=A0A286DDQ2_9GAMM|nr:type IV secretion system protein VirB1 [Pseudoxanthomonas wuyuanensis]